MNTEPAHVLGLWQKMIGGDQLSLGELFDIFGKELISYGYKICLDKSIAKDAVQDVFVDLWHYRNKLSFDVQVRFYLYRCVKRAVVKNMKWIPAGREDIELFQESQKLTDLFVEWPKSDQEEEQQVLIEKTLQLLSQREREIISLKYYSNLKLREIAEVLDLKEQTIANTLQNALLKLRKYLKHLPIFLFFYIFS